MKLIVRAVPFITILTSALTLAVAYLLGVDVSKAGQTRNAVTFTDRTGAPLGTILASDSSHAVSVPLSRVSPAFVDAIIAAEDARFYRHGAIDVAALLRAGRDLFVYGEPRSGGSTIAMQLARLLHPSGKLLQIVDAERIGVRSSKAAILEAYVNRVPMGGNLYGVEAAARTYFGEPASDLDVAQASLLAAIPNDPGRLSPDTGWTALRVRQQYVLGRMVALGELSQTDASRAYHETLHVRRHDAGISDAAHALFFLYSRVPSGSGRVRTTLDRSLQRFVQAQTRDVVAALDAYHVNDAAALVVDNTSGAVIAYVGSPDYFADEILGRNDGVQALRQPGSSLKPFTYETALEDGTIRSTTILPDVPSTYAIPGGKLYQPADYSGRFSGPVRVRYALANSLNVPAVHVLSSMGVASLLDRLRALRFEHLDRPASYYGLGLTLGSGEVTLWELVQAYATMARGGSYVPLHLTGSTSPSHRVGDASTWALVGDMLADPHARAKAFGVHSVLEMPFWAAVKTGTSSDFRDTWTVGFTREYTVGVWVGNFDGSAMRGVSGVTGAGPLWNRIMLHLHENAEPPPYPPPPGYVRARICATTGHAPLADCRAVVEEWVLPRDLAFVRRAAPMTLSHEYDPWLAQHREVTARRVRIVFPHDGDLFVRNAAASLLQMREQRVALRAIAPSIGAVRWSVNGAPLALDANGTAFLPVSLGTWTVRADDGRSADSVTIHVVAAPRDDRPGFTALAPRPH